MAASRMSEEPMPAAEMGARRPKYFRMKGAPTNAVISRKILASKAIVPNSVATYSPMLGVLSCVMRTDEME